MLVLSRDVQTGDMEVVREYNAMNTGNQLFSQFAALAMTKDNALFLATPGMRMCPFHVALQRGFNKSACTCVCVYKGVVGGLLGGH